MVSFPSLFRFRSLFLEFSFFFFFLVLLLSLPLSLKLPFLLLPSFPFCLLDRNAEINSKQNSDFNEIVPYGEYANRTIPSIGNSNHKKCRWVFDQKGNHNHLAIPSIINNGKEYCLPDALINASPLFFHSFLFFFFKIQVCNAIFEARILRPE